MRILSQLSQGNSNAAVGRQLGVEAGALAGGEFSHAVIVAVVHVVIYKDLDIAVDCYNFQVTYGWGPRRHQCRCRGQRGTQKQGRPREGYQR